MLYDTEFLNRLERGLRQALPAWNFSSTADLSLLSISENALYLVSQGGRRLVLRVHRPAYHSEAEILSELAWIAALRSESVVTTPRPVPTCDGTLLTGFDDGATQRLAVAFEFMDGGPPDEAGRLTDWFAHLGAINARLHAHAKGWSRPRDFVRKTWTFETILGTAAYWGDWREALGLEPAGRAVLERAAARLRVETTAFGMGPDRFGLVHCDLRAANLLVKGERLGVIDFDDCGLCWFAYDFAAAISFIEHEPFVPKLMAAWIAGYRSVAPLPKEQERALPMLIMLRRMQLTAWIASHRETPTAQSLGAAYTAGTVALAEAYLSSAGQDVAA